jgi:uncharacterized protein
MTTLRMFALFLRRARRGGRDSGPAAHVRVRARWSAAALASRVGVFVAASMLALVAPGVGAQDPLPVPALTARVIDQTGTLGPQRDALDAKLAEFERASGPQIVILMVASTQPEDITAYAWRVADAWKIGRRAVGDGVLVVVAKNDHRVRIEVAKALEGAIPDLAARQIIDRAITPAFKAGDYAGGLSSAIDLLEARIKGENLPAPDASTPPGGTRADRGDTNGGWGQVALMFFFGVFFIGRVLRAMLGRSLGTVVAGVGAGVIAWLLGAGVAMAILGGVVALIAVGLTGLGSASTSLGGRGGFGTGMLLGSMLGSGFGGRRGGGGFGGGGFGGGGGGFSSGGGGDFGGGGASGGW